MGPWPRLSLEAHPRWCTHLLAQEDPQEASHVLEGHSAWEAAACRCELELPLEQGPAGAGFPTFLHWGQPHPPSLLAPDQLWARDLQRPQLDSVAAALQRPETSRREAARMVRGPEATTFHHIENARHTLTSEMLEQFGVERGTQVTQGPSLSCCSCPCLYVPLFHLSLFNSPPHLQLCTHRNAQRTEMHSLV